VAWYITRLAWDSWVMDERSSGLIALPMWIPQAAMAWGAIAFVVAMVELAVRMRAGERMPGGGDAEETASFEELAAQSARASGSPHTAEASDGRR
jgi:hypothetical protein